MDSPGHSAWCCTYTFMEIETLKILVTMDKKMTGRKSAIFEKACFLKSLHFFQKKEYMQKYEAQFFCQPVYQTYIC